MTIPRILAGLLLSVFAVCPIARADMEIIAHRGAMSLAPENTLASQRLAYELGADTVEVDVRMSLDGIPVIMHDNEMVRTTGQSRLVGSYTLAQLKSFEAGSWFGPQWAGEPIPTLAEMLAVAKEYNRNIVLDIKGQFVSNQVVKAIRESGLPFSQIRFLTWWKEMTADYVRMLPGCIVMRGPTIEPSGSSILPSLVSDSDLERMRQEQVKVLCFHYGVISRQDIQRFHAAGFEVSLIYPPPKAAFYYADAGLKSFWTDFTEISVPGYRRTLAQWNNWADSKGLSPDQRKSWQDPDGDGVTNLTEFAMGTEPAVPDRLSGFPVASGPAGSRDASTAIDWTLDLRENWSEFMAITPQTSSGSGVWTSIAGCCTALTPTRLQFRFPVTQEKARFYRLQFELRQ